MAGGMNAAIEAQNLSLAGTWLSRVTKRNGAGASNLREKERYLSFKGEYRESAEVGREAIKGLPHDRDVVVYLGYDLLHLEKYDQLLSLTSQYLTFSPKSRTFRCSKAMCTSIKGSASRQAGLYRSAESGSQCSYGVRKPRLHVERPSPGQACRKDFEAALKREPDNGEAHLGLAYASLDLRKPRRRCGKRNWRRRRWATQEIFT
jgi:tetratricopeptide (TPR) repeat protein